MEITAASYCAELVELKFRGFTRVQVLAVHLSQYVLTFPILINLGEEMCALYNVLYKYTENRELGYDYKAFT